MSCEARPKRPARDDVRGPEGSPHKNISHLNCLKWEFFLYLDNLRCGVRRISIGVQLEDIGITFTMSIERSAMNGLC